MRVNKEHPPTEKEINEYIKKQKGLSEKQKEVLKNASKQTWFRQYVKDSDLKLKTLTKTVKKQIKRFYNEKGTKIDRRGEILDKKIKKGVTKKEMKDKVEKSQKLTRKEREEIQIRYTRAPTGRPYSETEIHEGKGSKRAQEWRMKHGLSRYDYYDRTGKTKYKK